MAGRRIRAGNAVGYRDEMSRMWYVRGTSVGVLAACALKLEPAPDSNSRLIHSFLNSA